MHDCSIRISSNDCNIGTAINQKCSLRSRSALPITVTELKVMAAAASIGLSNIPKSG
jgi:hypothetical protein